MKVLPVDCLPEGHDLVLPRGKDVEQRDHDAHEFCAAAGVYKEVLVSNMLEASDTRANT